MLHVLRMYACTYHPSDMIVCCELKALHCTAIYLIYTLKISKGLLVLKLTGLIILAVSPFKSIETSYHCPPTSM